MSGNVDYGGTLTAQSFNLSGNVTVAAGSLYRQGEELRTGLQQQSAAIASLSAEATRGRAVIDALSDRTATRVTLVQTPGTQTPGTQTPEPPKPPNAPDLMPNQ